MARCLYPMAGYFDSQGNMRVLHKSQLIDRFPLAFKDRSVSTGVIRNGEQVFTWQSNFKLPEYRSDFFSSDEWKIFYNPYTGQKSNPFRIPCGKCIECRLNESKEWANRVTMENMILPQDENRALFVTLTYTPDQEDFICSYDYVIDCDEVPEDIEMHKHLTLVPSHVARYIHDVRQYFERKHNWKGVRFYLCGEYGSKMYRPHFHIILLNLPPMDYKVHHTNSMGNAFFEIPELAALWRNPDATTADKSFGFVCFAEVSWESIAYTARYCLKKFNDQDERNLFIKANIHPVFSSKSTHPGLGYEFYQNYKESIFRDNQINLPNGRVCGVPRYFKKLYEEEYPSRYRKYKEACFANMQTLQKVQETDQYVHLSEAEYFSFRKEQAEKKVKKLIRHTQFV